METLGKIQQELFAVCSSYKEPAVEICCHKRDGTEGSPYTDAKKCLFLKIANERKVKNCSSDVFMNLSEAKINGLQPKNVGSLREPALGDGFIKSCILNDACTVISMKLNRARAMEAGIREVLDLVSRSHNDESIRFFIINPNVNCQLEQEECFSTARILAIASHFQNVLLYYGHKCHILVNQFMEAHIEEYSDIFKDICHGSYKDPSSCKEGIESVERQFIEKSRESSYRKYDEEKCERSQVELDLERYLKDSKMQQGRGGFDTNLKSAVVVKANDCPSSSLRNAAAIENGFNGVLVKGDEKVNLLEKSCYLLFQLPYEVSFLTITNANQSYESQMSCLVLNILSRNSDKLDKLAQCSCGPCLVIRHGAMQDDAVESSGPLSFKDYVRLKSREIQNSYYSRYGPEVKGEVWEQIISDVTTACVRLDLLSFPLRSKVLLNANAEGSETGSSRQSVFILYNYSRLSTLLSRFDQEVSRGTYPTLPKIDDIDFALLREEQEWRIFLKYVMFYPVVVEELRQSLIETTIYHIQPSTNKIYGFLSNLARDISSYYQQTKVLLEPRVHLQPLMYARVYLIKALEQVMLNAFNLIGIKPPSQM